MCDQHTPRLPPLPMSLEILIKMPSLELNCWILKSFATILENIIKTWVEPNKTNKWPLDPAKTTTYLSILSSPMIIIFAMHFMGNSVPKPSSGGQRKLWSDWVDVPEVDQSLCWEHKSFCWFCHALAQLVSGIKSCYFIFISNIMTGEMPRGSQP